MNLDDPTPEQLAVYMAGTKGLQWDSLTPAQQDRWREMAQMRIGLDADI